MIIINNLADYLSENMDISRDNILVSSDITEKMTILGLDSGDIETRKKYTGTIQILGVHKTREYPVLPIYLDRFLNSNHINNEPDISTDDDGDTTEVIVTISVKLVEDTYIKKITESDNIDFDHELTIDSEKYYEALKPVQNIGII